MRTVEKVALVAAVREEHALTPVLAALGLPRATWYYQQQRVSYAEKYAYLRGPLETIARKHPGYGIPRITTELQETYDQAVNHKVVQRLLQLWDLALLRSVRPSRPGHVRRAIVAAGKRANLVAQMSEIRLFQVAYTDFTELRYADGSRKAYLMPLIGHVCKMAYGWAVGAHADTTLALEAWQAAQATFHELRISPADMIVHHDQDPVYTGYGWTAQLLLKDQARLSYALNGAKDNPQMQSFIGRFKTENHSLLLEAADLPELCSVVTEQMLYYNTQRRHSSLGYMSPLAYIKQVRCDASA